MESSNVFSLDTAVGRREFIKRTGLVLGAASLSGMLGEILASCASPNGPANVQHGTTTVNIASLTSNGQFIVDSNVSPDGTPILVIRQSATFLHSTFHALHAPRLPGKSAERRLDLLLLPRLSFRSARQRDSGPGALAAQELWCSPECVGADDHGNILALTDPGGDIMFFLVNVLDLPGVCRAEEMRLAAIAPRHEE